MRLLSPKLIIFILTIFYMVSAQDVYDQKNQKLFFKYVPFLQNWKYETDKPLEFSQLSNVIALNYNYSERIAFSMGGGYAHVSGDVNELSGFNDSQIALTYRLKKYNLVVDAGINIPNGKEKLSENESKTSRMISQNIFMMHIPNLGQGLNYYLGSAWAVPLTENIAGGVGFSYQIRGAYSPESNSNKYHPSDEVLLTAGLDYRLTNVATLSFDVTGMFYGSDRMDNEEIFAAGRRIIVNLLYQHYFGHNLIYVFLQYRDQALDELKGVLAASENEKVYPNQLSLIARFQQRFSRKFLLTYLVETRFYEETASPFSGYDIYGLGLEPVIRFSTWFETPVFIKYIQGQNQYNDKLKGLEAGLGLRIWL